MSSSHTLCRLPSVKKQRHDFNFFFAQCIIKQWLDEVFVISRIIEVSVSVISLCLRLITPTLTSIILDITKTSSNNILWYEVHKLTNTRYVNWWTTSAVEDGILRGSENHPHPHPHPFVGPHWVSRQFVPWTICLRQLAPASNMKTSMLSWTKIFSCLLYNVTISWKKREVSLFS